MERYRRGMTAIVGWALVGVPVVALLLRFGMRALIVRRDVAFPGFVYWATDWVVSPFYRWLPAGARFDRSTLEAASLAAAGVVFLVAVGVYLIALSLTSARRGQR